MRKMFGHTVIWTALAAAAIALGAVRGSTAGQDAAAPAKKPAAAKKTTKPGARLPNYYAKVVDEKQREAIYKIQEEYAPKIAALKAQLDAITKERDEKIAAVLTPEQLKKIQDAAAAAKAKRSQAKSPPAEAPAEKPAPK